jgi:hypothetical protein
MKQYLKLEGNLKETGISFKPFGDGELMVVSGAGAELVIRDVKVVRSHWPQPNRSSLEVAEDRTGPAVAGHLPDAVASETQRQTGGKVLCYSRLEISGIPSFFSLVFQHVSGHLTIRL